MELNLLFGKSLFVILSLFSFLRIFQIKFLVKIRAGLKKSCSTFWWSTFFSVLTKGKYFRLDYPDRVTACFTTWMNLPWLTWNVRRWKTILKTRELCSNNWLKKLGKKKTVRENKKNNLKFDGVVNDFNLYKW